MKEHKSSATRSHQDKKHKKPKKQEHKEAPKGDVAGHKIKKVMTEFGEGKLHSGSKKGPQVTNKRQALAIAISEARKAKKK